MLAQQGVWQEEMQKRVEIMPGVFVDSILFEYALLRVQVNIHSNDVDMAEMTSSTSNAETTLEETAVVDGRSCHTLAVLSKNNSVTTLICVRRQTRHRDRAHLHMTVSFHQCSSYARYLYFDRSPSTLSMYSLSIKLSIRFLMSADDAGNFSCDITSPIRPR